MNVVKRQVTGPLHGSRNLGLLPDGDTPGAVVFECRTPRVVDVSKGARPPEPSRSSIAPTWKSVHKYSL
jgi:hypothetical protein